MSDSPHRADVPIPAPPAADASTVDPPTVDAPVADPPPSRPERLRALAAHVVALRTSQGRPDLAAIVPQWLPVAVVLVALSIAVTMAWLAEEIYDVVTAGHGDVPLDRAALDLALRTRTETSGQVVTGITDLAGTVGLPVIVGLATLALCVWWRSLWPVLFVGTAGAGSLLMTVVGKDAVGRLRPPHADAVPPFETSPSFPSGHTLNATVLAGIIAYLICLRLRRRRTRLAVTGAAGLFALVIGGSRVYLGHHWLTDVLVGWVLGIGWLAAVVAAHRVWLLHRPPDQQPVPVTA